MCENAEKIDRLDKLLAYVLQLGRLRQTPTFKIEQYKQLNIWEHELKGRIGIQHNIDDDSLFQYEMSLKPGNVAEVDSNIK